MPAAIAIPLIVGAASTGATIYAANKASGAAKDAARQQSDSAAAAMRTQQEMMGPYVSAGQSAATTLGRLMGVPSGATFAAAPVGAVPPGVGRTLSLGDLSLAGAGAPMAGGPMQAPPMGGQAPPMFQPQAPPAPGMSMSMGGLMAPGGAPAGVPQQAPVGGAPFGMVMLESPDGSSRKAVPPYLVDQYLRAGARRVG